MDADLQARLDLQRAFWQRVNHDRPVIVHAFFTVEDMQMIIEKVPPEGLCVIGRAETPDHARRVRDALLG